MTITTVTPIPTPVPSTSDTANFAVRADATLSGMAVTFAEFNLNVPGLNAAIAAGAAAVGAANYVGAWSGLTGALNIPASVSHNGRVWLLVSNTANVTTITPGVSSQWLALDNQVVPINNQAANYTLTLSDGGRIVRHPSEDTTARTYTLPSRATLPWDAAGATPITFINENGAGLLTLALTADTIRLQGTGATGNRTLAANGIATLILFPGSGGVISGVGLT